MENLQQKKLMVQILRLCVCIHFKRKQACTFIGPLLEGVVLAKWLLDKLPVKVKGKQIQIHTQHTDYYT